MWEDFALERRHGEQERHRENSGRLAMVYQRFETTGQGSFEFEERIDFGLTYVEEPFVAYGSYVDLDDLANLLDLDNDTAPPFPVTSGHVTNWDQDENDFYVGAWVGVRVYFPPGDEVLVPIDALTVVRHHFSFQANAIKDVPLDVRD
jgi:hypothetical protein